MSKGSNDSQITCFHCGLNIPKKWEFSIELNGQRKTFCCPACQTIALTIIDSGLEEFYRHRNPPLTGSKQQALVTEFAVFDDSDFHSRFVTHSVNNTGISEAQLYIGGIHCTACIWLLEEYLQKFSSVIHVSASLLEQKITVRWHSKQLALSVICEKISSLGYEPEPYLQDKVSEVQQRERKRALIRLGVAGIVMMQVGMFAVALYAGALQSIANEYRDLFRWVSLIMTLPVILYSANPFFVGAWRGLRLLKPGMDLPVATAIGLAFLASCKATFTGSGEVYFDSVTMFTFLLLLGRFMEMRARHYSGRLSSDLSSVLPSSAIRLITGIDGSEEQQLLPLFKVKKGDRLLIKPGQSIPADGTVISGSSSVNEAQLTGEFELQLKRRGDYLIAGSMNGSGPLTIEVESTGADLKLQAISRLVDRAREYKPRLTELADKLATAFVVGVFVIAIATYIFWSKQDPEQAFWIMLSVLVVSCPCALSLATPAVITNATTKLRKRGILVTRSHVWQSLASIDHVVCDKTGTLTKGEFSLADIVPIGSYSKQQALRFATALESYSEHPIAKAFHDEVSATKYLTAEKLLPEVGGGIEGCIDRVRYRIGSAAYSSKLYLSKSCLSSSALLPPTVNSPHNSAQWILLSNEEEAICWFSIHDSLRDDAQVFIDAMQQRKLKVHLLSGDRSNSAERLKEQLGLDYCVSGASPEQKLAYVKNLQAQGARVLMLGDGLNDTPVLAAADISVAMVNASSLAKNYADCILLSGRLMAADLLLGASQQVKNTIRQNILWAITYNALAIPLAATAAIPPYFAALGMSLSSLVVLINAQRLRLQSPSRKPSSDFRSILIRGV